MKLFADYSKLLSIINWHVVMSNMQKDLEAVAN